jgi:hypothetical protein
MAQALRLPVLRFPSARLASPRWELSLAGAEKSGSKSWRKEPPTLTCGFQKSLQCCMAEGVKRFYDRFASNYHFIFEDWDASMKRQAAVLGAILEQVARRIARPVKNSG